VLGRRKKPAKKDGGYHHAQASGAEEEREDLNTERAGEKSGGQRRNRGPTNDEIIQASTLPQWHRGTNNQLQEMTVKPTKCLSESSSGQTPEKMPINKKNTSTTPGVTDRQRERERFK